MNLKQTQKLWKNTIGFLYQNWASSFCPKPKERMYEIINYLQELFKPNNAEYDFQQLSTTNPNDFMVDEDISKYKASFKVNYETPNNMIKGIKFVLFITVYLGEKVKPEINYYSDYVLEGE